jgi:hypothetical protein
MSDDQPLASRSTRSDPFGKADEEIKVRVPAAIKAMLLKRAYAQDMPLSEYVRHLFEIHLFGADEIQARLSARTKAVIGEHLKPNEGTDGEQIGTQMSGVSQFPVRRR